jgi:hypothetical protein
MEFETGAIMLQNTNPRTTFDITNNLKGHVIDGREDPDGRWKLTADTFGDDNAVTVEYILDGTKLKLGLHSAKTAAGDAVFDLVSPSVRRFSEVVINPSNRPHGIHPNHRHTTSKAVQQTSGPGLSSNRHSQVRS